MKNILILLVFICQFAKAQEPIRVAIIGGGMAGVSAAHHVLELNNNIDVTLFEKEKSLGGNARTIEIKNNLGKTISIDAGPQYFKNKLWPNYISFLKSYNLFNENEIYNFAGSAVIENDHSKEPDFITPEGLNFRGGGFGKGMQFFKFFKAARKVHLGKSEYAPTVGDWIINLKLKDEFKKKVALPFLASTLGSSVEQIKSCSTKDIVKLFASQKAMKKSDFRVFKTGMGTLIQEVGAQLEQKGVNIILNAEVKNVKRTSTSFTLAYNNVEETFDFVIFATHPYQAGKILENESSFLAITKTLKEFEYFQTSIVLHRDSSFIHQEEVSFMNIKTSQTTNEVYSSTMNLAVVNPEWKGLYKSWMRKDDLEKVKSSVAFIHQEIFNHPLITPLFHEHLIKLKQLEMNQSQIYFAGGWSEGLETQEAATNSGEKAAEKVSLYIESQK